MLKGLRGWYELNGKRTILNVLLLIGVFVFIDPVKKLLQDLPTDLFQIKSSWEADKLWLLSCAALIIWGLQFDVRSWGKYINRIAVGVLLLLFYLLKFRNINDNRLLPLCDYEKYYYFDIVIVAIVSWSIIPAFSLLGRTVSSFILNQVEKATKTKKDPNNTITDWQNILLNLNDLVVRVWNFSFIKKKEDTTVTRFIEDIPTDNEDELQRESYAKTLADKIIATTPKRAFNIGIFGEWGSGKSDFIHRIGKALRDQNDKEVIIVEFNPWRVGSNSSITEDYLQVLSRHLRPYSSRLSNSIGDYAKQFIDKADTTGIVKSASNILTDSFMTAADIESQYEAIRNEVSYLDKTIIVFIDDLDRLNKEEILETFKLIRNVADFPNTFFVLGLDYDYVMKTTFNINSEKSYIDVNNVLKKIKNIEHLPDDSGDSNKYTLNVLAEDYLKGKFIEKIFQTRISLPSISTSYVSNLAFKLFESYFKGLNLDIDYLRLINIIEYLENQKVYKLNFRIIKQIINSFDIKITYLLKPNVKIDFLDLLILTTVECLNYISYTKIFSKEYFIYLNEIRHNLAMEFSILQSENDFNNDLGKVANFVFKEQSRADFCFKFVFDKILHHNNKTRHSFSSPFMFYSYFSLSSFSEIDFLELFEIVEVNYDQKEVVAFYDRNKEKFINESAFRTSFLNYFTSDFNPFRDKSNRPLFIKSCMILADYNYEVQQLQYYIEPYLGLKYQHYDKEIFNRINNFIEECIKLMGQEVIIRIIESFSVLIRTWLDESFISSYGLNNEIFVLSLKLTKLLYEYESDIHYLYHLLRFCKSEIFNNTELENNRECIENLLKKAFVSKPENADYLLRWQVSSYDEFDKSVNIKRLIEIYNHFSSTFNGLKNLKLYLEDKKPFSEFPIFELTYNLLKDISVPEDFETKLDQKFLDNSFQTWVEENK